MSTATRESLAAAIRKQAGQYKGEDQSDDVTAAYALVADLRGEGPGQMTKAILAHRELGQHIIREVSESGSVNVRNGETLNLLSEYIQQEFFTYDPRWGQGGEGDWLTLEAVMAAR